MPSAAVIWIACPGCLQLQFIEQGISSHIMIAQLPSVISVTDAALAYGAVRALQGLSLELCEGELLGLLGPNGAGKSSLLKCISGRKSLDSGTIEFASGITARDVGTVPQEIAVYQDLSVGQNLMAFGKLHGVMRSELKSRCEAALAWSGLRERKNHLVKTLSGGMQRRLNIACSVLHQPAVLLLDEPTVGVDPQSRERIYEMIYQLLECGTSVLLTTHHLDEAQHRCDRIAIIDQGKIVQSGTLDELIQRTIGHSQTLALRLSAPLQHLPAGLVATEEPTEVWGQIDDAAQLPAVLNEVQRAGGEVEAVILEQPTLQGVFLHLTGRELRE